LTDLAVECARPPVRLVKMIGDAALLVSPEPDELLGAALSLMDAVDCDEALPSLRVGISRGGEWYGSPVNRASKLTAAARPGKVWATAELRDAVDGAFVWSKVGRRKLPGVGGAVEVLEVRRASADGGEPWEGYDEETVKAIRSALAESGADFAARVLEYEREGKHRKGVLRAAEARAG
jgi:class 3 adenylate cyclase